MLPLAYQENPRFPSQKIPDHVIIQGPTHKILCKYIALSEIMLFMFCYVCGGELCIYCVLRIVVFSFKSLVCCVGFVLYVCVCRICIWDGVYALCAVILVFCKCVV